MIRLENVSKFYYSKGVISAGFTKVNLNLEMGEFVAITGESGSGKSTLLNVISGLDTYEEGEMYVNGEETSHYTEKDFENYRRRYIGNIFQNFNLVNSYTVYQNIELVLLLNGAKRSEVRQKVNDLIEKVGLKEYKNTKASKLSGGQKQRVAIARALAKDTPIIIADEPTGNLDSESAAGIIELLSQIAKDKLVVIVTHNYDQVEPYVTRKIKMHDGKILENTVLKQTEKPSEEIKTSFKDIRPLALTKLGVRNAFNIPVKFVLLVFVFMFISTSMSSELAMFKNEEFENSISGYNWVFNNNDEKRIILKKNDKTFFTEEDYAKVKEIQGIDYVVENDLMLDSFVSLTDGKSFDFWGYVKEMDTLKGDVDVGRPPQAENEVVLYTWEDAYYFNEPVETYIGREIYLSDSYSDTYDKENPFVISGIRYATSKEGYDDVIYMSSEKINLLKYKINQDYSQIIVEFNGQKYRGNYDQEFYVYPSTKVKPGEVLVSSDVNYLVKDGKCIGDELKVSAENIYYTESIVSKITATYNKKNFNRLTGIDAKEYEYLNGGIFVNQDDYNKLFDKASFQSAVFAKEPQQVDAIVKELHSKGFDALALKDTYVTDGGGVIIRLLTIVMTAGLAIVLFFISYFVVRIILKSRNVYYTTIRMLGANVGVARNLLLIDMLVDATIGFGMTYGFIQLLCNKLLSPSNYIVESFTTYMGFNDYAAIYLIVVLIAVLVGIRYSKTLFKKSTMNTYKEEV